MLIEQINVGNSGRNFNYLIGCEVTSEALVIDPFNHEACLAAAEKHGFRITQIVNTHEHGDHTYGNQALQVATHAIILAHPAAKDKIPGFGKAINADSLIQIGETITLQVLATPGHTTAHICLLTLGESSCLFSGDTLFNAGVGNCHHGGDPEVLYHTFKQQLFALPNSTRVYPGHDYLINNLNFTLSIEPENNMAKGLLQQAQQGQPLITTLAMEREINLFFRLEVPSVIAAVRRKFPQLPLKPSTEEMFLSLRKLRDRW